MLLKQKIDFSVTLPFIFPERLLSEAENWRDPLLAQIRPEQFKR